MYRYIGGVCVCVFNSSSYFMLTIIVAMAFELCLVLSDGFSELLVK